METELIQEIKENAIYRLNESSRMIHIAFSKVDETHIWKRPNGISNSLGNQILHRCGNMTQYVIASLGKRNDTRNRDSEFLTSDGHSKMELLELSDTTIINAIRTINDASASDFLEKRNVQGFNFSGIGVVLHAVEHCSYHTGQIAFWVKQLIVDDLGFYDGIDLTTPNTN